MINITLWILQILGALLYSASGVMKVFMFDEISKDVKSFWCPAPLSMEIPGRG